MFIYREEIVNYQANGYIYLNHENIPKFERELKLADFKFTEPIKKDFLRMGLEIESHNILNLIKYYQENKSLKGTLIHSKETNMMKDVLHHKLKNIHNNEVFIPIYLVSLFVKDNYLYVYEKLETYKDNDVINEIKFLFADNNRRDNLYNFLTNKENMMTTINYLKDHNNTELDDEKFDRLLKLMLFLSKKEIDFDKICDIFLQHYKEVIDTFFEILFNKFEESINQLLKELSLRKDFIRLEVIEIMEKYSYKYHLFSEKIKVVQLANFTRRTFLVHEDDYLDILFVLD